MANITTAEARRQHSELHNSMLHNTTLTRAIREGHIEAEKFGNAWMVDQASFSKWDAGYPHTTTQGFAHPDHPNNVQPPDSHGLTLIRVYDIMHKEHD